ncbi:hypothetical protein K469DRAFT_76965 [Zopfia rhizophila CBS 207.26]|uniref:Uncharacterized protein n=1 Tax=Zopfia rhizophila CBS 207.26 TaxID=1314779 RepID=A0A6A6D846_9PEZI|nr:hypothetical protein K469DRAFT_76965 [Zopfia rhizophila CBS 207.26]
MKGKSIREIRPKPHLPGVPSLENTRGASSPQSSWPIDWADCGDDITHSLTHRSVSDFIKAPIPSACYFLSENFIHPDRTRSTRSGQQIISIDHLLSTSIFSRNTASAICSDLDVDMTFSNRPMRSISHSSAINSPNAVPSTSIPATPTNTPVTTFSSSTFAAVSPVCLAPVNTSVTGINSPEGARTPLPIPPMNTPASSVDSGVGSPQDGGVSLGAHPPVLLEAHHFESPMLSPTVPPNSPESWPFQVATDEDAKSGFHDDHQTSLGERLAALGLSAGSKVESPKDEVKEPEDTVARALGG